MRAHGLILLLLCLLCLPAPAAEWRITINTSTKLVSVTNPPAVRESTPVRLVNLGGSNPSNLVLQVNDTAGALYATLATWTNAGGDALGLLDLNTVPLVTLFSNVAQRGPAYFTLAVWDTNQARLVASDRIAIFNNPFVPGMAAPSNVPPLALSAPTNDYSAYSMTYTSAFLVALDASGKVARTTNALAVRELVPTRVFGLGATLPTNLTVTLFDMTGHAVSVSSAWSGYGTNGEARGVLDLNTADLMATFSGRTVNASVPYWLAAWDRAAARLLGVVQVQIGQNPFASAMPAARPLVAAALTPFPTNAWTAGYALYSSDGGQTTYAGPGGTGAPPVSAGSSTNVTAANLLANDGAGITSNTLYRGDWGAASSGKAARALSTQGGGMVTGPVAVASENPGAETSYPIAFQEQPGQSQTLYSVGGRLRVSGIDGTFDLLREGDVTGSPGMATWTNTADGGAYGISNVGWFASSRNTYLNTNDIPVGFFAGGGFLNRFGTLLFAPGYSNFEGSIFVGGYSNLYLHNAGRGLVAAGGISNTLNTADMTALALIGGANNYASGSSSYAGLVGGQRETISATHSFVGGGQDGLMAGSHSGKFGRGTTNSSSAYGLNWGYLSALRSAPFGFAGGDRCEAQATGAIALGSRARPSHNWAFVWAGLGPGVVGSSATNQWVFGNISGGFGIGTTSPVPGGLSVAGAFGHANGGRAVLTGGVCIITLPVAMPDANYRIQLTYATDPTLLTPLGATGTASAIYVWGSGSNPFFWEAQDNQ